MVAAVDAEIPSDAAYRVIDAADRYVTPGLIDFHTHVFHEFTYWGVDPDTIGPRSGVTTWVDAGSAGAITLPRAFGGTSPNPRHRARPGVPQHLLHRADRARSSSCAAWSTAMSTCSSASTALHTDMIVGVKVRMGTPTVGDNGVEPLRAARSARPSGASCR